MNHLMMKNGTIMKMKQLRRKNGRMMELKQARRNSDDGDRHRKHLGDLFLLHQSASTMIFIYLLFRLSTADPWQYYPNYRRPVGASSTSQALPSRRYENLPLQAIRRARPLSAGTPSPTGTSPQLSAMRLGDSSSEQSDARAGTPPLTQRFTHPDVSPSSTTTPSATPHDMMSALTPG
ncbi:hypothetical protein H5410_047113 [Solanum commersonii]|uniref:Uncharacterized protein n=1 Tax=Solanum commersonii TaxID=4109 RepID=A0A9J5XGB1_SOLCO|nr:hypothetical protein H5410_047113 [Solanum commersonii]